MRARELRKNMTEAEQALWFKLRRKQLLDVQFYRQRPIGNYVVDFYAPSAKLVIEVDGSQHLEKDHLVLDEQRDKFLESQGLQVLRFDNLQVLQTLDLVIEQIFRVLEIKLAGG
jgi:very-short-patch-repair endonuclease